MTEKDENQMIPIPDSGTTLFRPNLKKPNKAQLKNKKKRQSKLELKNDKIDDNKHLKKSKQHCSDYILTTLKAANRALNYLDFGKFDYGTLRNNMHKLIEGGLVCVLPKECSGRYILKSWTNRPEYAWVIRNDKKSRVGKFDFLSYLESLQWDAKICVHNIKFTFQTYQYHWIGPGWIYHKKNRSYTRTFNLSYPVKVQCFDTGTIMVHVSCSCRPFPLTLNGLSALQSLLGEVKNSLHAPCIPETADWFVAQWHLNRDSEILNGGGADVYLTFRDFFGDSAQFYYKHNLDKMRAEVSQSPKQSMKELFENVINRDNFGSSNEYA